MTFYDIICWALDGLLPYLDLPDIASGCMPGAAKCLEEDTAGPCGSDETASVAYMLLCTVTLNVMRYPHSASAVVGEPVCLCCRLCPLMCTPAESELSVLPVRCIQPDVSLTPSAFYNSSCQLADQLGLQLPHIAGEALLLREVQELGLPQVRANVPVCVCVPPPVMVGGPVGWHHCMQTMYC